MQANVGDTSECDETASPLSRRWLREGLLATVLLFVSQGAGLLSLLLISRDFLPSDFGRLSTGLALQNYLVLLGTLGLRTVATRDLARSPNDVGYIWGTLWALIGPIGAAVTVAGHFVAGSIFSRSPDEAWMSVWLAAGAWFAMLSLAPLLDAVGRQSLSVASVAISEVLFLVALLAGLLIGRLTWLGAGFALKWIIASVLQAVVLWVTARPGRLQVSREVLQSWRRSAPWLLATTLISHLPFAGSVVLVRSLCDPTAAAVTGLAVQVSSGLLLIAGLAFRFVQPMIRTVDDLRSAQMQTAIQRISAGLICAWVLGVGGAWALTNYWLPAAFHDTWATFVLFLTAALLCGGASLLWAMLNALEMEASILSSYGAGLVLFLFGSLMLIPPHGHLGAAWAALLGNLVTVLFMAREIQRGVR